MSRIVVRRGTPDEALAVEACIPEFGTPTPAESYTERLDGRQHLILVATQGGALVGYKVGYETEPGVLYSWLGGVIPSHRRRGCARDLRVAQETWARDAGFGEVRVKSSNRFPDMMRLLISSGYHIVGTEGHGEQTKVLFSLTLLDTEALSPPRPVPPGVPRWCASRRGGPSGASGR